MPPKVKVNRIPKDRCGGCDRTNVEDGSLICYGNLPHVILNEAGEEVTVRAATVDVDDPACFAFTPKAH